MNAYACVCVYTKAQPPNSESLALFTRLPWHPSAERTAHLPSGWVSLVGLSGERSLQGTARLERVGRQPRADEGTESARLNPSWSEVCSFLVFIGREANIWRISYFLYEECLSLGPQNRSIRNVAFLSSLSINLIKPQCLSRQVVGNSISFIIGFFSSYSLLLQTQGHTKVSILSSFRKVRNDFFFFFLEGSETALPRFSS